MKIEKLNDDKIRVIFNVDDLHEKNIDFHSFMSNSIESQKLVLDILEEAKNKVGFVTEDYKVLIETAVTNNGTFICNLTRIVSDVNKDTVTKPNVYVKRKKNLNKSNVSIYAFNCFEDFITFCDSLVSNFNMDVSVFSKNSKLFLYDSTYFLLLYDVSADLNLLESFCACVSEFAYFVSNSNCFENKLLEFGNLIIDEDAILSTFECFIRK